ncbi:MAG: Stk1 family PASTA domain-containing Ser/Thr kinase, partial [Clostridium paraputrificum]
MIGEILGNRYEIEEKIGEGGMSIVYKARCNKLNRYVAVKVLKKEMSDNEDIVNKFKREATAIAALSDNNIVNILDVGSQDDINYIVMEYVKGKTLKELIKQFGKLNYETAITIAIQIAKALECAHKNNIIHRDVKPQNILVTEEGLIKVTDFGIAKSTSSATLTNTTTIMGSAHYFSPEQAKGTLVDNRTDLYSLGVVLYEMVTGKVPFEADSPVTIALKHIQEEVVPPKQINSKIPESLNKLIIKAMEKDPGMRYQNARDIINDLQKIKEDPNAVIDNVVENEENEHTIIMGSVNAPDNTKSVNKALEDEYYEDDEDDEYYDDDYYDEDDDDEEYDGKKKKKKSYKNLIIGVAVVVGLLLLGVGAFAISGGFSATKTVKVPDLKGMTLEEAKKAIEDAGLE